MNSSNISGYFGIPATYPNRILFTSDKLQYTGAKHNKYIFVHYASGNIIKAELVIYIRQKYARSQC